MKPSIQTIRTLAAEFFKRLYKPVAIIASIVAVILLALSIWLTTLSAWWWILVVLLTFLIIVATVALILVWIVIKAVAPLQSKDQKKQAKALVDKMQGIAEVTTTPTPILIFQLAKDILMPSKDGFIASIGNATSLTKDISALRDSFKQ